MSRARTRIIKFLVEKFTGTDEELRQIALSCLDANAEKTKLKFNEVCPKCDVDIYTRGNHRFIQITAKYTGPIKWKITQLRGLLKPMKAKCKTLKAADVPEKYL